MVSTKNSFGKLSETPPEIQQIGQEFYQCCFQESLEEFRNLLQEIFEHSNTSCDLHNDFFKKKISFSYKYFLDLFFYLFP